MKRVPYFVAWLLCHVVIAIMLIVGWRTDGWHEWSLSCLVLIAVLTFPPARQWIRDKYFLPVPVGPSAVLVAILASAAVAFCSISPDVQHQSMQTAVKAQAQSPAYHAVQFDLLKREASVQVGEQTLDERISLIGNPSDSDLTEFLKQQAAAAQSQGFGKIFIYAYTSKQSYLNAPMSWRARAMRVSSEGDAEAKIDFNDPTLMKMGETAQTTADVPQGNWQFSESVSPIDDVKTSVLSVSAEQPVQVWLKTVTPSLLVRCKRNELDVIVHLDSAPNPEYDADAASVRIRLDKQPPLSQSWDTTTTNDALVAPASRSLMARMLKAKMMMFEFTPFSTPRTVVIFNIDGFREAQKAMPKICQIR